MFDITPECRDQIIRERIHLLWDRLAELPASDPEQGINLLLSEVGDLIDSPVCMWFTLCRVNDFAPDDVMQGWRAALIYMFNEQDTSEIQCRQTMRLMSLGEAGECLTNNIRTAGTFRASLIKERVSPEYLESELYHRNITANGFRDSLAVICPVNADTEIYAVFQRRHEQQDFTHNELNIASYCLRSLTWFHRQTLLTFGLLLAEKPLTDTERQVMRHLLTDYSEKQIACALDQKLDTTHKHITNIYRKFNVNSRAALMAVWLNHSAAA